MADANVELNDVIKIPLLERIKLLLPANRVAALGGIVLSVVAFLTTIQTSLVPGSPAAEAVAKAAVLLGAIAGVLAFVVKFLEGSQRYDQLILEATNLYEDVADEFDDDPDEVSVDEHVIEPVTPPTGDQSRLGG